jgi:hypothetical protein
MDDFDFDFENFNCLENNKAIGYEFKKEIPSTTQGWPRYQPAIAHARRVRGSVGSD